MGLVAVLTNSFASAVTIGYMSSSDVARVAIALVPPSILDAADAMVTMSRRWIQAGEGDELGFEITINSSVLYIRKLLVPSQGTPPTLLQSRVIVDTHWPCF